MTTKIALQRKKPVIKFRTFHRDLDIALDTLPCNTQKSVRTALIRIMKEVFHKAWVDLNLCLQSHSEIISYYESNPSRRTMLGNLIAAYKLMQVEDLLYDDLKQQRSEWAELKKEATEKEKEKILSCADVQAKFDRFAQLVLENPDHCDYYSDYVLLALYTYLPPIRQGEYCDSRIVQWDPMSDLDLKRKVRKSDQPPNVLCLNNKKLVISKYKTFKTYGIRVIDVPHGLVAIIRHYHEKFKANYVLSLKTLPIHKMKSEQVTKSLNRLFHHGFSVDQLRSVYISEHCPEMSILERNRLAYIMAHSVTTQENVYNRFKKHLLAPEIFDQN